MRIIGDIHEQYGIYKNLLTKPSIQIGDMGFNYKPLVNIGLEHRFFGGNHDNYDEIMGVPNNLGDFGEIDLDTEKAFFIRGGWSIDRAYRTLGKSLWADEELPIDKCFQCIEAYEQTNADIVLSHECPLSIVEYVTDPKFAKMFGYEGIIKTRTNQLLQHLYEIRQPKLWCFGHYHTRFVKKVGQTTFVCVNQEEYIDLYQNKFIYNNLVYEF